MKRSRFLFFVIWLGLLGLIATWWQQRYVSEAEELEQTVKSLQITRENRSLKVALQRMDEFFVKYPVRLDSILASGDTVQREVSMSFFPESKSLSWQQPNEEGIASLEMHKPKATDLTAFIVADQEDFNVKIQIDSKRVDTAPDTMINFDFNFLDIGSTVDDKKEFFAKVGDSLGVQLTYLTNKKSGISPADTLNEWYLEVTKVKPLRKIGKSDFKLIEEFVVFKNFRSYLLQQIWPELLAGISLMFGLTGFFFLVRRDLQRQEKQLEQKDRLLANVAHELKTPIATVGVALEALQNFGADTDPERRREYTDIARQELDRLNLLSERALRTIQLDAGGVTLQKSPVNVRALVERAWSSLALKYSLPEHTLCFYEVPQNNLSTQENDLDFKVAKPETAANPYLLTGDAELLLHLIYNLLDNACKYGGDPPAIEVGIQRKKDRLQIDISDNGPGIPTNEHQRIFEKFYRVDTGDGHLVKGHGLGLSYARQIVEAHGGSIAYIGKNKREWSTFRVLI